MDELTVACERLARGAKAAARTLALAGGAVRDEALTGLARRLRDPAASAEILAANAADVAAAETAGLGAASLDRLRLDPGRLAGVAKAVDEIRALPDPLGEVVAGSVRPNGLRVLKVREPLGVVLFLYESRPNVTIDAAALCLKSGNAVILRGGSEARRSNLALHAAAADAAAEAGLPPAALAMVESPDRAAVGLLLAMDHSIDVAIPRGGPELIRRVAQEARMPVLKHYQGVCHVYLDASADGAMATAIVENAKCSRPGVCNAAEALLVHSAAAERLLPTVGGRLAARGVELRACPRALPWLPGAVAAAEGDFGTEFLALTMAVRVVDDLDAALEHIARYGSGHTEAIVTNDYAAAERFVREADAAAVVVNASTRFHDGGELGLGAEIGISTDKLHARGPCGLRELTTTKYIVRGDGQIRV